MQTNRKVSRQMERQTHETDKERQAEKYIPCKTQDKKGYDKMSTK